MRLADHESERHDEELITLVVVDMHDPVTPILEAARRVCVARRRMPTFSVARFAQGRNREKIDARAVGSSIAIIDSKADPLWANIHFA